MKLSDNGCFQPNSKDCDTCYQKGGFSGGTDLFAEMLLQNFAFYIIVLENESCQAKVLTLQYMLYYVNDSMLACSATNHFSAHILSLMLMDGYTTLLALQCLALSAEMLKEIQVK